MLCSLCLQCFGVCDMITCDLSSSYKMTIFIITPSWKRSVLIYTSEQKNVTVTWKLIQVTNLNYAKKLAELSFSSKT